MSMFKIGQRVVHKYQNYVGTVCGYTVEGELYAMVQVKPDGWWRFKRWTSDSSVLIVEVESEGCKEVKS